MKSVIVECGNAAHALLSDCPISCFADEIDENVDKQIALMKELGITWVEFRSGDKKSVADYTLSEASALKQKLDQNKIRVSAIGSPIGKIGITDDFAPHFEKFTHIVKLAEILETRFIRMFSFYMPAGRNPAAYRDAVINRLRQMTKYAAGKNMVLLHENEKGIYGDTASRCLDLMQELGGENFRVTFDFANFVQCGQNPLEAFDLLAPHISYIHIKDALMDSGEVVLPGQGDGHLAEIFQKLAQQNYSGFLSLEPHLADFAGLKNLEQEVKARGRSDQTAAFCQAYNALLELLHRNRQRP